MVHTADSQADLDRGREVVSDDETGPGGSGTLLARHRYLWLAIGLVLHLGAVGGRWDLSLAAWLFPIFLLRFTRSSRAWSGLLLVWLVGVAGALFWTFQFAVPFSPMSFAGVLLLGSAATLAFAVDRLAGPHLGTTFRIIVFASVLSSTEFLLGSYFPFGTAYGMLGVTQHGNLALLQVISVAGPYVIALLIGVVAASVVHAWERGLSVPNAKPAVVALLVVAGVIAVGQARLAFAHAPSDPTVRIAGVNPSHAAFEEAGEAAGIDVLQEVNGAWPDLDPEVIRTASRVLDEQLFADTHRAADAGAQIVVWSETAALVLHDEEQAFLDRGSAVAQERGIYLNVAASVYYPTEPHRRNRTYLIDPDGEILWTYDKAQPIPGLEDLEPGDGVVPVVETPYGRLANVICFDADFPSLMRVDADIMLVPGWDWPEIGRTHTKMSSLRAIENGYSLVRVAYDSSSEAYDYQGHVLGQQDTTSGDVQPWIVDVPIEGTTTLNRLVGDAFAWLATLIALAGVFVGVRRARGRSDELVEMPTHPEKGTP